jgi:hypothetical protein
VVAISHPENVGCGSRLVVVVVNDRLVAPVIPPRTASSGRASHRAGVSRGLRRRVPVPALPSIRGRSSTYSVASVNDRGRIAADVVLRVLGWGPGARMRMSQQAGLLVVTADPVGSEQVTPQGHLRLPVPLRRWCGLEPGSRVLLVVDSDERRLVVHPPAALDAMISDWYGKRLAGDAA